MSDHSDNSALPKTAPHSAAMAGWLTHSSPPDAHMAGSEEIAAALNTSIETHHAQGAGFACAGTRPAHFDATTGLVGLIIGHPRWFTAELGDIARELGDSAALVAAYRAAGENLTSQLRGAYAFALMDPLARLTLLGVDRLGRFPLYFSHTDNGLLFGSSVASLKPMCTQTHSLSEQSLYDYVYFHMVPSPHSIFAKLERMQPACILRCDRGGVSTRRHWMPVFSEQAPASRTLAYQDLKSGLRQAVADNLPATGKVGAFLSGGLDSSTVTGMLAELTSGPCDVYSIGFSAKGYDEMPFARITAEHFGARLHEYYVTPEDIVECLPMIAGAYDEPFGNSSALPAYFCAKVAADDGVSVLLAGDGGDELFAGNERYAKQKAFDIYHRVPEFLGKGLLEPLLRMAPAWLPLAGKARSYIAQANTPLPDRLQTYNFLHRHPAQEVFQPHFLEQVDTRLPLALLREVYHAPKLASSLNRMLYMDWKFTLADNDLRKVSQTCALAGIDVAYPMLDDKLVELSTAIPSEWKMPGRQLRDFYKKALTGWLPEATITKTKQGFGLPFGVWMREHRPLQEIAYDNILKLKSRDIFISTFLDEAINKHRDGHAAYFGELVWILCVLELWLQNNFQ